MADQHDNVLDEGVSRTRLARVYAEALLSVAGKANQRDAIGDELDDLIRNVLAAKPDVEAFLNNPTVSKRQKEPMLREAFAGLSEPVRNLLGVLNQNNRLGLIRSLAAVYRDLRDQQAGRVRVTVKSAVKLSDDQINGLKATLEASLKKAPVIVTAVEPDLIGGLIVQIGDRVIDTSVRTRIQTLRTQLMERGTSYVLQ